MYGRRSPEICGSVSSTELHPSPINRCHPELGDLASKESEPSQTWVAAWLDAEMEEERRFLDIFFCSVMLDDVTLVLITRKPFDVVAEGLSQKWSGADGLRNKTETLSVWCLDQIPLPNVLRQLLNECRND